MERGRSSGDGVLCGEGGGLVHGLDVCPDAFNYYLNDELIQAINRICGMRPVCKDELVKLRGRPMFARARAFCRYGGAALRSLNAALTSSGREVCLSPKLVAALLLLRDFLSNAPPRQLKDSYTAPVLLSINGSAECDDEAAKTGYIAEHLAAGIGGVLVDAGTNSVRFFSSRVPLSLLRLFLTDSPRQVIARSSFCRR